MGLSASSFLNAWKWSKNRGTNVLIKLRNRLIRKQQKSRAKRKTAISREELKAKFKTHVAFKTSQVEEDDATKIAPSFKKSNIMIPHLIITLALTLLKMMIDLWWLILTEIELSLFWRCLCIVIFIAGIGTRKSTQL